MVTICYNLQFNEYFLPKFTQYDPLWTLITDVWYRVSQNSTFKVAFTKAVEHYTKISIFQTFVKLINTYWGFKFQAILWSRGAKIGAQKGNIKIDFKKELLQNT